MAIGLEKVQKLSGEVCQRIRNDHEQFLEAYEKPTQIYRFLTPRHNLKPLFLQRNLSYMPRHSRNPQKRFRRKFLRMSNQERGQCLQRTSKADLASKIKSDNYLEISFCGLEHGCDYNALMANASGSGRMAAAGKKEEGAGMVDKSSLNCDAQYELAHGTQMEIEVLLFHFKQSSIDLSEDTYPYSCSSLGKQVLEYKNNSTDKNGWSSQSSRNSSGIVLMVPESVLTWKANETSSTQMLVFRASCAPKPLKKPTRVSAPIHLINFVSRKGCRKNVAVSLNRLNLSEMGQTKVGGFIGKQLQQSDNDCLSVEKKDSVLDADDCLEDGVEEIANEVEKRFRSGTTVVASLPCGNTSSSLAVGDAIKCNDVTGASDTRKLLLSLEKAQASSIPLRSLSLHKRIKVASSLHTLCDKGMTQLSRNHEHSFKKTPKSSKKAKKNTKDASVMTNISFGMGVIPDMSIFRQSPPPHLASHDQQQSSPSYNFSATKTNEPYSTLFSDSLYSSTAPLIRKGFVDKCTSPKLTFKNSTLNGLNGYALPEVAALRAAAASVSPNHSVSDTITEAQVPSTMTVVGDNVSSATTGAGGNVSLATIGTGDNVNSATAGAGDIIRSVMTGDGNNVRRKRKNVFKKRNSYFQKHCAGTGKLGTRSFLVSVPRVHYDSLLSHSHLHNSKTSSLSNSADKPCVQAAGATSNDSLKLKRRTEIERLQDTYRPASCKENELKMSAFSSDGVPNRPPCSSSSASSSHSWLCSSTRKITPVNLFRSTFSSSSSNKKAGNVNFGSSMIVSGCSSNSRKRSESCLDAQSSSLQPPVKLPKMMDGFSPRVKIILEANKTKGKVPTSEKNGKTPTSEKNGKAATSEKNGKAATSEKNGKTPTSEKNGKTPTSEKIGKTPTSEKNGKAATSEKNGKAAATSEKNGKTPTSEKIGKTPTSEKNGKAATSEKNGKAAATSEKNGKTPTSEKIGKTPTSEKNGKAATSEKNGKAAATSEKNGKTPTSEKIGKTPTSEKNGKTPTSEKNGKAATSEKNGKTPTSEKIGKTPTSEKNGKTATSEKNGKASTSEKNGKTATSEKNGKTPTTEKNGMAPTSEKNGMAPTSEKNGKAADVAFAHKHPECVVELESSNGEESLQGQQHVVSLSSPAQRTVADHCSVSKNIYSAELVMFDSRGECLVKDGKYSLLMQNCTKRKESISMFEPLSWSTVFGGHDAKKKDVERVCSNLLLKFTVSWSHGPPQHQLCSDLSTALDLQRIRATYFEEIPPKATPPSPRPTPVSPCSSPLILCKAPDCLPPLITEMVTDNTNGSVKGTIAEEFVSTKEEEEEEDKQVCHSPSSASMDLVLHRPSKKILFNYRYSDNKLQKTESKLDLVCPWCSLSCVRLYSLLKHMSLCHPRFHFTYTPEAGGGHVVDVHVNKMYDVASPSMDRDPGEWNDIALVRRRTGPLKCLSCSAVFVERHVEVKEDLSEFMNDGSWRRGYKANRVYHHCRTCLPMLLEEVELESGEESQTLEWQRTASKNMIDEFTDVNDGEKKLMTLWNNFAMDNKIIAEKQISPACLKFAQDNGILLLERGLVSNFLAHLVHLFEIGLISPSILKESMSVVFRLEAGIS